MVIPLLSSPVYSPSASQILSPEDAVRVAFLMVAFGVSRESPSLSSEPAVET
ncbi:hypothetical protein U2150_07760 [Methanothermobacter wolfeii]|uniref:Uncharacterized protein n=1 Tax=Methanothermobacter wolfeii TaxID=145261 RepID=A0ABU8TWF6_METWO